MKVVFYDGDCGFCNKFIQKLMGMDHNLNLKYAPLQGETARAFFNPIPDLSTVIFVNEQKKYYRSEAAIRALAEASSKWNWLKIFLIVPQSLRDGGYDLVARNRHRLSRNIECPLPTSEQRQRFLP